MTLVTYVSPMPRHRRAPYGEWKAALKAALDAGGQGQLARTLNSAALLFAEHDSPGPALDCLLAQLVLVDEGTLAAGADLDAFVNAVRLSMFSGIEEEALVTFWLDVIEGSQNATDLAWLVDRARRWREEVIDTLVQETLRKQQFVERARLTVAVADAQGDLPGTSLTLRQEYLARSGAMGRLDSRTEVFTSVVAPLLEGARDERRARECAARACQGLNALADRIDGSWWRAVASTAGHLPAVPGWLEDLLSSFLQREPLLANALPPKVAGRFVNPANLRNPRLSPDDLSVLSQSVVRRLACFPGISERTARYAGIWRQRLRRPLTATGGPRR